LGFWGFGDDKGKYSFDHKEFDRVSNEAKDLINKMIVTDSKGRLTAKKVLEHPWFSKFKKNSPH